MEIKKNIPNSFTLLNLLTGCIGIIYLKQNIYFASTLIWVAVVFDFLDGFLARKLNAKSEIGKQLDSLADMVSFGLLPALILFNLMNEGNNYLAYGALLIAIFSALRLAKFNTDEKQSVAFIGVPTPANALLISSLPFILNNFSIPYSTPVLLGICIILSVMLVAPVKLMALKFENFSWQDNITRYLFIIIAGVLIALLKTMAIPMIYLIYLILSILRNNFEPK